MIYTLTFAPSIDYLIEDEKKFDSHGLNRIEQYSLLPGGKGINASVILTRLKVPNQAIYFGGGVTCDLFESLLTKEKLKLKKIEVTDSLRINVKYFNKNQHFEINGPRPFISSSQKKQLLESLKELDAGDLLLIMGQCDPNFLVTIVKQITNQHVPFAVDIDHPIMWDLLPFKPLVIKPNIDELSRLKNEPLDSELAIINCMQVLREKGAQNVIVSNGSKGSHLLTASDQWFKITLKKPIEVVSTVGAGDTLLAGFIAGLIKKHSYLESIVLATALSLGTVTRQWLAKPSDIKLFQSNIIAINKNKAK